MNKKDILKDLFEIIYDWVKPVITTSDTKLDSFWYSAGSNAGAFFWDCDSNSSNVYVKIGARLYEEDDIVIWTGNKNNIVIVIHPVEKSIFTGIYSIDVMLNSAAEFDDFSKEEMMDLCNRIIDFNKGKHHAVIHSEEELSNQYTSMSIQDVPEGRDICEKTLEKDTMEELKELPPFVKTRCIPGFDTDALKIGHPYRVTSERYGEQIMFLNKSSETLLHFFKLIVYDGEVQRQEEYLVSIDNVVNDGYMIQEMK